MNFIQVIVAGYEVIKLFYVLQRQIDSTCSPWCHKKHGLSLEMFDIIITKLFIMVVFEYFESIGGLQLSVV